MGKPRKAKTPQQIAADLEARRRADFEAVNLSPDSASLAAFSDVQVERIGQRSDRNRAWRSNVFRLLLERKTITSNHYDAAQRLIEVWAQWKGLDGKPETFGAYVDGGSGSAELVTDRMIRAGKDVARTLGALDPTSRLILEAFMVATVEEDRPMVWRGIMERLGYAVRDRQTKRVVAALEELRVVYEAPRERRAA